MAQLLVEGGEPSRNLERATLLVEEAVQAGCELVVLPETVDFGWTHPSALTESQPIPGKFSDHFVALARKHRIHLCVGLTERAGEGNYNAALLIGPLGEVLLKYRKINLLEVEFPYYEVGQELRVVRTSLGNIGVNICSDNYMDGLHLGHALARMGAQLVLSPSSWTVPHSVTEEDDPYGSKWVKPLSILSSLYGLVIVSTTSVGYIVGGPFEGRKMVGCSLAVGPEGVLHQGLFNELSGALEPVELELPRRMEKGTSIGKRLAGRGYRFDDYLYDEGLSSPLEPRVPGRWAAEGAGHRGSEK